MIPCHVGSVVIQSGRSISPYHAQRKLPKGFTRSARNAPAPPTSALPPVARLNVAETGQRQPVDVASLVFLAAQMVSFQGGILMGWQQGGNGGIEATAQTALYSGIG